MIPVRPGQWKRLRLARPGKLRSNQKPMAPSNRRARRNRFARKLNCRPRIFRCGSEIRQRKFHKERWRLRCYSEGAMFYGGRVHFIAVTSSLLAATARFNSDCFLPIGKPMANAGGSPRSVMASTYFGDQTKYTSLSDPYTHYAA